MRERASESERARNREIESEQAREREGERGRERERESARARAREENERDLERVLAGTDDDAINIKHRLCLAAVLGLCRDVQTCVSVRVSMSVSPMSMDDCA